MAKLRFKFGISFSIQYIPTSITLVFHANIIAGQGSVNTDSGGCKGQESQGTCNGDPLGLQWEDSGSSPASVTVWLHDPGVFGFSEIPGQWGSLKILCFILKYLGIKWFFGDLLEDIRWTVSWQVLMLGSEYPAFCWTSSIHVWHFL